MEINIPSARTILKEDDPYTVYTINIKYKDWTHSIERRYSEFHELHREMKLLRQALHVRLPHLPGKHIWKTMTKSFTEEDIQNRRLELEEYLNRLRSTECAKKSQYFPNFLEMPIEIREVWMEKYL